MTIPANMSEAAGWAAPLRVVITACDGVQPFPAWNEVKRMFVPYLITYGNRSPRDYVPIYRLMQSWRAVRLAESVWLADLDTDAIAILRAVLHAMQLDDTAAVLPLQRNGSRSEEHTSELQSLMRISYAVFCLKKKNTKSRQNNR